MSEQRVAGRYAKALVDLSRADNTLEQVYDDMKTLESTLHKNISLDHLIKSPVIPGQKKLAILKSLFEKSFTKSTIGFFGILINKKREYFLGAIATAFIGQYHDMKNMGVAEVTTAVALDDKIIGEISRFVEGQTGKKTEVKVTVDPKLIGGIVIRMDDKLFDASIAGQLRKAKKELLNTYISK